MRDLIAVDEFRSSPQLTTIPPPERGWRGSGSWGYAMRSRMARRRPCRRHPGTRTSVRKNRMYDRMRLSQSLPAVRPVGTRSPPLAGGGPGGASVSAARGADSRRVIRRVLAKTTSVATADKSPAVWQRKMSGRRTEQVGYLPTPMGATSEAGTCLTRTPSSPLMSYEGHLL